VALRGADMGKGKERRRKGGGRMLTLDSGAKWLPNCLNRKPIGTVVVWDC